MRTKRALFQSLFAKLRAATRRSSLYFWSAPSAAPVSTAKRKASAPYGSAATSGSTTLPRDFVIFSPFASRMRPWKRTLRNGHRVLRAEVRACCRAPNMIIRAHQKNMMS